jgi:hypothetical protein
MSTRIELLEDGFASYNRGHISPDDPTIDRIAPDAEWHSMVARLPGQPFRGPDGFLEWYAEVQDVFRDPRVAAHRFQEDGDRVLVLGRFSAVGRASGAAIDEPILHVFDFDGDERIRRYEAHLSPDEELMARLGWATP